MPVLVQEKIFRFTVILTNILQVYCFSLFQVSVVLGYIFLFSFIHFG